MQAVARFNCKHGQMNIFFNFASTSSRSQILKVCEHCKNLKAFDTPLAYLELILHELSLIRVDLIV